jgi:hypothetical protein
MGCAMEAGRPGAHRGRGRVCGALPVTRGRHRARGHAPPACVLGTWPPRAGLSLRRPVRTLRDRARCCSARRRRSDDDNLQMMTSVSSWKESASAGTARRLSRYPSAPTW